MEHLSGSGGTTGLQSPLGLLCNTVLPFFRSASLAERLPPALPVRFNVDAAEPDASTFPPPASACVHLASSSMTKRISAEACQTARRTANESLMRVATRSRCVMLEHACVSFPASTVAQGPVGSWEVTSRPTGASACARKDVRGVINARKGAESCG